MSPCFCVSHRGWCQHADIFDGTFPYSQFWIVYLNESLMIKSSCFQSEPWFYWRWVTFEWHIDLVLKGLKRLRCGHYKSKSREYCEVLRVQVNWELYSAWIWSTGCANHKWTMDSQCGTVLMSCSFNVCFVVLCVVLCNEVSFLKQCYDLLFQNFYKEIEREEMYIRYVCVTLVAPSALWLLWVL